MAKSGVIFLKSLSLASSLLEDCRITLSANSTGTAVNVMVLMLLLQTSKVF